MPENHKPLIGISCHLGQKAGPEGQTRSYHRLGVQYTRTITDAGGLPVLLPTHTLSSAGPSELLHRLDGLLLSGGTDLPEGAFTSRPNPSLREVDPDRYDYETILVREARQMGLPLLGICRGHQTLAEALGGTLILNVEQAGFGNHYQDLPHEIPSHEITNHGFLADRLGKGISVNSFHRQAVAEPPEGFTISAWGDDGLIEAIWSDEPFALGLQFHPEWLYLNRPGFLGLFEEFIRRSSYYSAGRKAG